jgi:hypothetical protein
MPLVERTISPLPLFIGVAPIRMIRIVAQPRFLRRTATGTVEGSDGSTPPHEILKKGDISCKAVFWLQLPPSEDITSFINLNF